MDKETLEKIKEYIEDMSFKVVGYNTLNVYETIDLSHFKEFLETLVTKEY